MKKKMTVLSIKYLTNLKSNQLRFTHDWIKPKGCDTGIKIYNCITRSKQPFIVDNKHFLKWYTCGPTVYDSAHIGHASCYMKLDIIQRILKNHFNLNLVTVMNITDIDDKIIKRAIEMKTDYKSLVNKYEKEFWNDLANLGILQPDIVVKVTENINLIIDFIQKLEQKGFAYKGKDDSIYFDVGSFKKYGKLQNLGQNEQEKETSSVKKSITDFALWKRSQVGEPFWVSPWGNGRPGWHIECSTLASHSLGSNIDIHAGGIDLRFPHHENEETQSCVYHDTSQWVNYWIHTGHLSKKDSEKMSKSLKNTITIGEMLKDSSADVFRMACVLTTYNSKMEYSLELLETARNTLKTYHNFIESCTAFKKGILKSTINIEILMSYFQKSSEEIHNAFCDDFNTPKVMKILNELLSVTNSMFYTSVTQNYQINHGLSCVLSIQKLVQGTLEILGINFDEKLAKSEGDFVGILNILNEFRQNVRTLALSVKNVELLNMCDNVRDSLKNSGIVIKDHKHISSWSKGI